MALTDNSGIADPVYARVRERIRKDILSGYFEPGSRIKTAVLGARYGVSQMPIREALQSLQGEGLVTIAANRGASVRAITADFIRNIYDIRAALETMLVRRAVQAVEQPDIFSLYAAETRFEDAVTRSDMETALKANWDFHNSIFQLAKNPEAMAVIARHAELIEGLRRRFGYGTNRAAEIIGEHRELLRAFDQRDLAGAMRVTEQHTENAKLDLLVQAGFISARTEGSTERTFA